jgi:acyl phosphate:glycerol-3-phosphate acyltransferase
MLELAVKTLIAYLLGSLMGALILGALRGVDIRTQGSGNAGGTNALRTQGKAFALGVIIIDIAKGWFAAAILPTLPLPGLGADPALARDWLAVACASAATAGHVWPVWYEFRGGKGAATVIGVILGIAPGLLPALLGVWLLVVMLTGFVGLGTMLGVAALPVAIALRSPAEPALLAFSVLIAAFVVYTHRSNIQRMLAGNENRARKLWLVGRLRARAG